MAANFCATGTVVALPPNTRLGSGATHALLDARGRHLFLLRSTVLTLDALCGKTTRVCGTRRGQVAGEPAPLLQVTEALDLRQVPLRPGLNPFVPGAALRTGSMPARPLVRFF